MNLFESEPDGFRTGFTITLAAEESAQARDQAQHLIELGPSWLLDVGQLCDSQTSFHFFEGRFFGASEPVAPVGNTGSDARR